VAAAGAPTYLCLQLGDALVRAERWNDAAEVYSSAVRDGSDDVYGRRRLQALYKAGRYDSALRLCDEVDSANGRSRFAAEMRSSIYEVLGDLGRAAQACKDFLAIEPRNPVLGLRLALVLQRTGDVAASAIALANLDPDAVTDIESASILAQMLVRIGKPHDALEVAYRMRHRHLQNVDAHVRYVSLYTLAKGLEDTEQVDPVTPDSAVLLEGPGAPGWVLVSASNEADLNQREYSRSHQLARGLLGKRVGDSVSIGGPTSSWTVAAIGTKYGFAFGRTLELFPSHFPTNSEIEQHPIPKGDGEFLNQLKERLQQGDPRRQAALNEYAAGRCTVGSVATILRISTLKAIGTILNAPGGLVCSTNSVDERSTSLLALAATNVPLLLDLTAIIALDGVGMLRDGTLARYPLFVAQRTLDEIASEELRWQTTSSDGAMSIGVEGDVLTRYVTTPEEVILLRKHFGDLLAWLRAHVVVAPVPPDVAERHATQDRFGDFIGESAWDTIRIATAPELLLVSDDLLLRLLGKNTMAVNGVCTAMLLMAEMQTGRLDRDRYCEAMVKLIASGYRHLSVDGSILEAAARADQWRRGAVLGKVLDRLRGPETHAESAMVVGVEFIRRIWLNVVLSQQRVTLLIAVLDVLIAGRNRAEVLTRVRLHVGQALALLPLAQEEVFRVISGWSAMGVVEVVH
jgi:tetratricopeptide (TPR) repeat protein